MLKFAIPVAVVAVIAVFFYVGLGLKPQPLPSPLIGKAMPEFSLPRLEDPQRTLSHADLEGGVSLLNVWGSWCTECRIEHPCLTQLAESGRVPIFGLNVGEEHRAAGLAWLADFGDPYVATGYDAEGGVSIDWGVYGAPETFLLGSDGRVLHKRIGVLTPDVWRNEFEPLLHEVCGDKPCPLPAILREAK
jgi:cytochrome c biogenesis protein CcmG/thiol:disulfide interchange protein DsbE